MRKNTTLLLTVLIMLLVVLVGCSIGTRKPNLSQLPVYPSAQGLSVQHSSLSKPDQVMTFQTTDSFTSVLAFYREKLLQDGWEDEGNGSLPYFNDSGELYLSWIHDNEMYTVQVVTRVPQKNVTNIEVKLASY